MIHDESGKLTPNSWALRAAHLFDKFNATRIIAEDNVGGDMVKSTLKNSVERTLPYKGIKARRGKYIRAEPVAALYEQTPVEPTIPLGYNGGQPKARLEYCLSPFAPAA